MIRAQASCSPRRSRPTGPPLHLKSVDPFSAHFGKQFRLTHYLPMYFTVRQGGINTQFWARYTDHLPIGYRPGNSPPIRLTGSPHQFNAGHLAAGADLILHQRATEENATRDREASRTAEAVLRSRANLDAATLQSA